MPTATPRPVGGSCAFAIRPIGPRSIVVHVEGTLDVWSGATLNALIEQNRAERVGLDLSGVSALDPAGWTVVRQALERRDVLVEVAAMGALAQLALQSDRGRKPAAPVLQSARTS